MAIPRVFISSTFYDLKQVREDLERFIREMGYEPIRNETGSIPYGKDDPPECYAYWEVELCDILISIIGGRYGSESQQENPYSISQRELRTALEHGIQVFIFIEKSVQAEFSTYQLNKDNKQIKYRFIDNLRIYEFIDEVYSLPRNNPIAAFETSADITSYLRSQRAGLFRRFLQEQKRLSEMRVLEEMKAVAGTMKQLEAIRSILLANHPAFRRFAEVTNTNYRIYFTDSSELGMWRASRGFHKIPPDFADDQEEEKWRHQKRNNTYLKFKTHIF